MADNNTLNHEKSELIDIERKDGILEELDLPPKVIKAIRENATALQILGLAIILILFGWTYYDYYSTNKKAQSSEALNLAILESEKEMKIELLKQVEQDYSGSDAALWSSLEQAHQAFKDGDYQAALEKYLVVEGDLASDNPLRPVLYHSIGLSYENSNDLEKALSYYTKMGSFEGFNLNSLMAKGRVLELKGQKDEALKIYLDASADENLTGSAKSILTEKINNLQVKTEEE